MEDGVGSILVLEANDAPGLIAKLGSGSIAAARPVDPPLHRIAAAAAECLT